jgi:class 3 adenylate cyclase
LDPSLTEGRAAHILLEDDLVGLDEPLASGVHTGECEVTATGLAVHIAARVAAGAEPGEVRVSSTVKDLVAGSGIRFIDLGAHSLKGVPGEWVLFAVEH